MADKSLAYFMRETAKKQEIVEIPGIDSIKDANGNVVNFKVKILTRKEIDDIYEKYRTRTLVYDKKGRPVTDRGQAVYDVQTDSNRAMRRIVVEALVYPNLKDKELMDYFECPSFDEMPLKVFPFTKEYDYVTNAVLTALGLLDDSGDTGNDADSEVQEAKN